MDRLKDFVDSGKVEIAKLNGRNQPQKIEYEELNSEVQRKNKYGGIYQSIKSLDWDEKY